MGRYIIRTDFGFAGCQIESDPLEIDNEEEKTKLLEEYHEQACSQLDTYFVPVDENGNECEEDNEPELNDE